MKTLEENKLIFYVKLLLAIVFTVGLFGMIFMPKIFNSLTPLNLLTTAAVLFYFQPDKEINFYRFILFIFASGFAIELLGIETGKIFGSYHYGDALGFKIKETPVIIGLNWVMLVYISGMVAHKFSDSVYTKSFIGAFLMVIFDFFIELQASHADLWYWKDDQIPVQNFVAWFLFSFFFNLVFCNLKFKKHNPMAVFLYVIQLLFFILLNLYHQFIK